MKRQDINGKVKQTILRSFLLISIIFSVFLVSNCDDLFNHIPIFPGNGGGTPTPPEFGGSESSSYATKLFKSVAEGAAGEIGGAAATWALSAIGLSNTSPDYTEQLDKIDLDLQTIINELNGIQNQLNQIYSELTILNCSQWSIQLKDEKSSIDNLMSLYQTFVSTAASGAKVSNDVISDWTDQVLAQGNYSNKESMGKILAAFSSSLVGPNNTGVIPACVQSIASPAEHSFGTDTVYYNQVKLFTDYYYAYQVRALFLYSEARHYQAWVKAGSPNSEYISADSVSYICSNLDVTIYCNYASDATNTLYNSLLQQLTAGGAPYSDKNLVLEYGSTGSFLWPLSLEDFSTANGDNCADPLTSQNPCGITAGFYNSPSVSSVVYKGYTGWGTANSDNLTQLLAGWTGNLAGTYLENNLGFKNMTSKIIISSNYVAISLNESGSTQYVVPFFDTDFKYTDLNGGGGPAITEVQFQENLLTKVRTKGGLCSFSNYYYNVDYKKNGGISPYAPPFYNAYGHARHCGSKYVTSFSFSTMPGWLARQDNKDNREDAARQYRWPILNTDKFTCTDNRSKRNAGGISTMCGDDFTAWLNYYVPRPQTCDNPGSGTSCIVTGQAVASARSKFGNNSKSGRSL